VSAWVICHRLDLALSLPAIQVVFDGFAWRILRPFESIDVFSLVVEDQLGNVVGENMCYAAAQWIFLFELLSSSF
jgi:hypothetical protein